MDDFMWAIVFIDEPEYVVALVIIPLNYGM
jgi:hypothetical protein